MTVYIEKAAINLREELTDLRNQGTYQEQQFYFDGLVTNGTFDTDTTGWTAFISTLTVDTQRIKVTPTGTYGVAGQAISTKIGKTYRLQFSATNNDAVYMLVFVGTGLDLNAQNYDSGPLSNGVTTASFTATATTTWVKLIVQGNTLSAFFDNVSVFETDGTDVVHRIPKGWVPKDVFEDGLLQREGSANDYTVVYDGFDYYVKPAVSPSATTTTCVIGVRK